MRLCSMKNQVNLTPHQLETWVAVLSCFDDDIVTRVILEIGLSVDPFPDIGKIVTRCEVLRRRRAKLDYGEGRGGPVRIGDGMLKTIASALQLKIA